MINILVGSKMLGINNPRDEDWLTFVEKHTQGEARKQGYKSIEFLKKFIKFFLEGKNSPDDFYKSCFLYQLSNGFHDEEDYPFKDFNIFEHKEVWIKQLKAYMNSPKTEERALKRDTLCKTFYHIVYQYQMILENTHFISKKTDVQKIHDYEMPSSYFYELRDMINSL